MPRQESRTTDHYQREIRACFKRKQSVNHLVVLSPPTFHRLSTDLPFSTTSNLSFFCSSHAIGLDQLSKTRQIQQIHTDNEARIHNDHGHQTRKYKCIHGSAGDKKTS